MTNRRTQYIRHTGYIRSTQYISTGKGHIFDGDVGGTHFATTVGGEGTPINGRKH
jgi:hypothetical protein